MATKKDIYKLQARHKPLVKACLDRDPEKVVDFLKKKGTVPNLLLDLCGEDAVAWDDIYDTTAPSRESAAVGKPYRAGVWLLIKGDEDDSAMDKERVHPDWMPKLLFHVCRTIDFKNDSMSGLCNTLEENTPGRNSRPKHD
jgi:hypothetical protein